MFQIVVVLKHYWVLIHLILGYESIVWNPHTTYDSYIIEWVQLRVLLLTDILLSVSNLPSNYGPIADLLNLNSLADNRGS